MINTQQRFTEPSTNTEYNYVSDYNGYRLYKLIRSYNSTRTQILTADKLINIFLQESFETPGYSYSNVIPTCGTTILAFFAQNTTVAMENIHALLLAGVEAFDNSRYICFISVLKQHREKGLGTKLMNELIKEAVKANNSRVSLHVNTDNTNALSLYLKCGMRCSNFISNFYYGNPLYASSNAFEMTLQTENIRNSTTVCQSTTAVTIPQQQEALYRQRCPQASTG